MPRSIRRLSSRQQRQVDSPAVAAGPVDTAAAGQLPLSNFAESALDPVIVIELLGHPRGKGRPRRDRMPNGAHVTHTDNKTREYESNLKFAARKEMAGREPLTGPLSVLIIAYFPVPASWSGKKRNKALAGEIQPTIKPDWNNIGGVTDGLNGVVWGDDRQIVEGTVNKRYSDRPRLVITVRGLPP